MKSKFKPLREHAHLEGENETHKIYAFENRYGASVKGKGAERELEVIYFDSKKNTFYGTAHDTPIKNGIVGHLRLEEVEKYLELISKLPKKHHFPTKIEIPLTPTTQQRVRVGKFGAYKKKSQRLSEEKLIFHLEKHRCEPLLSGCIILKIECYFARPLKHFRKAKGLFVLKPDAPIYSTNHPDWDNIGKQVCDCGNEIIWKDDKFIVDGRVIKKYTSTGEPRMVINVSEYATQESSRSI